MDQTEIQQADEDPYIHPELRDLAPDLDDEELTEVASTCLEDFKRDLESRTEWDEMHAEWLRLYFQKDTPKNPPWQGSSAESIPLLAEACNQFHARAYQAMFPNRDIVRAIPVGHTDEKSKDRAKRVGTHLSWQLMVRDSTYKRNKDRLLLSVPLHGSYFTKSWYDPVRKKNIVQNVRATDLVVPYGTGPRDLEEIERKTQVLYIPEDRCKHLYHKRFFSKLPNPFHLDERSPTDQAHDELTGFQPSGYNDGRHCKIIEQHRFLDLDEDGLPEPYIVWIDLETEQVLRISIRYDTDELGNPTAEKEPIEYYTHYTFLENPDGFYGLGYGHIIGQINTAINKLLRQTVDAGTLATAGNNGGFVSDRINLKGGQIELQLGKFIKIPAVGQRIQDDIMQMSFPGPNPTIQGVIEVLMARGDRLAFVTDAITGQTDKVMQPTTVLALVEQSLQGYSAIYERILSAWEQELNKLYRLNRKYMDPQEYFTVLDVSGQLQQFYAAREDYEDDFQIKPIADPKMTTERQRLARAEAEYNFALSNPLIAQSPVHLREASRRYLEAIGSDGINEILPNIGNMALPRIDDPMIENQAAMATGSMPMAFPDQDHQMHVQIHFMQLANPELDQGARASIVDHIKSHNMLAFAAAGAMNAQLGGMGGPGQPGGMVPQQGGGMVPPETPGPVQSSPAMGNGGLLQTGEENAGARGGPAMGGGILPQ